MSSTITSKRSPSDRPGLTARKREYLRRESDRRARAELATRPRLGIGRADPTIVCWDKAGHDPLLALDLRLTLLKQLGR